MAKHCEHWYWDHNIKYRYRRCKFCGRTEYNYTGKWEREISLETFISRWTPLDGPQTSLVIEATQKFEFQCYETWGACFYVKLLDKEDRSNYLTFGPFANLNQADAKMRQEMTVV